MSQTALHQPTGRAALGASLAATTMVLWAVLPFALSLLLRTLDPVTVTWARFCLASAALSGWLALRGELPALGKLGGGGARLLAAAVLGLALNYVTYLAGLGHTTPASAPVLNQLSPLLLSLGGLVVFGERFDRLQWIGFGLLIAGLGLFSAAQLGELAAGADRYALGIALLTFGSFAWAAYALAQKQLLLRLPAQPLMLLIYVGCAVFLTPFAQPSALASLDATGVALLAFCAANTLLAYGAFAASLEHWEASRVSAVLACAPLVTLAIAAPRDRRAAARAAQRGELARRALRRGGIGRHLERGPALSLTCGPAAASPGPRPAPPAARPDPRAPAPRRSAARSAPPSPTTSGLSLRGAPPIPRGVRPRHRRRRSPRRGARGSRARRIALRW